MKPQVRCYYWGEENPVVNLGDSLVPVLLDALGFRAATRQTVDADVINPGRCLLVIGSLLTERDLKAIAYPVDVWGCGWKGPGSEPAPDRDIRHFAVRGPHTSTYLRLVLDVALGDPALLLPKLVPMQAQAHGNAVLIPHFSRLSSMHAAERLANTACDEVLSPMVLRRPWSTALLGWPPAQLAILVKRYWRHGIATRDIEYALRRIAGARFVLTGSLHGAILAQAYGVPWACYHDGYLDAPAKWLDWGSYLGIDIDAVRTLKQAEHWWENTGRYGKLRDLEPLLNAFPYGLSPT